MKPWEIIQQLESNNSRLFKESVLTAVLLLPKEEQDPFWWGCEYALNPLKTFGVKKVPHWSDKRIFSYSAPWKYPDLKEVYYSFNELVIRLEQRIYTGDNARAAIEQFMVQYCSADQWDNWFRRILIKDLRCGVTEKTINKARPGTVPLFECQLAKDGWDNPKKLVGKKLLDFKLDGVRTLAVVRDGRCTLFSRSGNEFENFPHIVSQIEKAVLSFAQLNNARQLASSFNIVLDGEITSDTFQDLMKQVHRKSNANAADAVFNVFDIIDLSAFIAGKTTLRQKARSEYLANFGKYHLNNATHIKVLPYVEVNLSTNEGMQALSDMRDEAAKLKYEGVMVKDADAVYECKRSTNWLKLKPTLTVDLEIVDIEEGTGKNSGKLGAFVCEGFAEDGRKIHVNVGSGLSDDLRNQVWAGGPKQVRGMVVEIKADAITISEDNTDEYSLRFPRFERFRGFKKGEKI